jgi:hypothetical protein
MLKCPPMERPNHVVVIRVISCGRLVEVSSYVNTIVNITDSVVEAAGARLTGSVIWEIVFQRFLVFITGQSAVLPAQ